MKKPPSGEPEGGFGETSRDRPGLPRTVLEYALFRTSSRGDRRTCGRPAETGVVVRLEHVGLVRVRRIAVEQVADTERGREALRALRVADVGVHRGVGLDLGVDARVGVDIAALVVSCQANGDRLQVPRALEAALGKLARGTAHAATFITAFHDQTSNDLTKYSTGAYLTPDTTQQNLSGFTKFAQSQMRNAAIYSRVNTWATAAQAGSYTSNVTAESSDVDLDGEPEYLLFNDRIFVMFERLGGRMTNAWARDIDTGEVFQVVGNPLSYSGSETEEEGTVHLDSSSGLLAYRTSGFKDWFAQTGAAGVGTNYVNDLYTVNAAPSGVGWRFISSDGKIVKTITLGARATMLDAQYAWSGNVNAMFVRFGMSPNLYDLILHGQGNMQTVDNTAHSEISVLNTAAQQVRAFVKYGGAAGLNAVYNRTALDQHATNGFDTVPMRNQAQTQQLEIANPANTTSMSFSVGFQTGATISIDSEGAGIPDWWRQKYFGHVDARVGDLSRASDDADGDGKTNLQEYIFGTDPTVKDFAWPILHISSDNSGQRVLTFSTMLDRVYHIQYSDTPGGPWTQAGSDIPGTGSNVSWTDNGTKTGASSTVAPHRFYKLQITLQ